MVSSIHYKWLAVLSGLAGAACSPATVVYDNFGPGDTFNIGSGWTASGPTAWSPWTVPPGYIGQYTSACQFAPSASGMLSEIDIAVSLANGTNGAQVALFGNAAGDTVGPLLTSWSITGLPTFGNSFSPQELTAATSTNPSVMLQAGQNYWVGVFPGAGDTWAVWNESNYVSAEGPRALSLDGGVTWTYDTQVAGALRVEATAVPEPFTLLLGGAGVGLAFARRRKANKG